MRLPNKIRLKVLRRHIVKGLQGMDKGNPVRSCVVAQALREKFPQTTVGVGIFTAWLGRVANRTRYTLSKQGTNLIYRACDGKSVKPTTITLTRRDK